MTRLAELFVSLQGSPGEIVAAATSPASRHRVARAPDGRPLVLISTPGQERGAIPGLELENLAIRYGRSVSLQVGNTAESGCFASIECLAREPALYPVFLDALQGVVDRLPPAPRSEQVAPLLERLVEVFRSLGQPARTSPLGAWGELFVMASARSPAKALRAWHADPLDLVDFADAEEWLEVKTTTSERRQHEVSLRQLQPPHGVAGFLASVQTSRSNDGLSLRQLTAKLAERLADTTAQARLNTVLAEQLGKEYPAALDEAFDERMARQSLAVFAMRDLPALPGPLPNEITGVRYSLDLGRATPAPKGAAALLA